MLKKIIFYMLSIALTCTMSYQCVFATGNLIQNPSFEDVNGNRPSYWNTWVWDEKPGIVEFTIGQDNPNSGENYAIIENKEGRDSRYVQDVRVEPNSQYKASAWIKAENVGRDKIGANISLQETTTCSLDIKGTVGEWQYTELYIRTGEGVDIIKFSLGLGGYGNLNTGKACFDDVVLEKVDSIPEGANVAFVESRGTSTGSSDEKKETNYEDNVGKYTWVWHSISSGVLIVIFIYYVKSGKLKLWKTKDKE
ncbi:MAG: carbohydrate-binding protein [Clostridiaceae bacterium]|nr:carbohydrate-binding protein [Clostridiaceae bacterium]